MSKSHHLQHWTLKGSSHYPSGPFRSIQIPLSRSVHSPEHTCSVQAARAPCFLPVQNLRSRERIRSELARCFPLEPLNFILDSGFKVLFLATYLAPAPPAMPILIHPKSKCRHHSLQTHCHLPQESMRLPKIPFWLYEKMPPVYDSKILYFI